MTTTRSGRGHALTISHLDRDTMAARPSSVIGSIWGHSHNETALVATDQAQYLTDEEISRFLDDLDHNGDGMIDYDEVEQKLDAVHDELIPQPRAHNILARKRSQLMRRLTRLHSRAGSSSASGNRDKERESGNGSGSTSVLGGLRGNNATGEEHTGTGMHLQPMSMDGGGAVLSATTTRATSIGRGGGVLGRVLSISSRRMTTPEKHFQRGHRHTHSQGSSNNHHRHEFLRSIIGSDARRIPREEFAKRVKEWNIPSLELNGRESNRDYVRKMSLFRRIRAYWAVHGPEIAFLVLVVGLQLAFGVWQLVKYTREQYEDAFGWGIGMAKAFAGALYPTMFFLIISMSRYVSTFLRRSYWLGRFINWDLSQSFHVKISIVALVFSTLHTIGHLTGTFRIATEEDRGDDVASLLGDAAPPGGGKLLYHHFVVSVPGITGIIALVLFYLLALLSMPVVRRWNYEVFQLGHLLMYPIIGFLIAHGSAALLQYPMLGFWMMVPTVFVLAERLFRVGMGFYDIQATVRILDGETVEVTVVIPNHLQRSWVYKPGQYVFFQVPKISRFQWHPFTVSVCVGKKIQLLIKTDGNWTKKLRELADESGKPTDIIVGINGPFGAPAQRFYDYDHAIIVGSGIGVTPFSGILSDLQARDDALHAGPGPGSPLDKMNSWNGFGSSMADSERLPAVDENEKAAGQNDRRRRQTEGNLYTEAAAMRRGSTLSGKKPAPEYRRVDFHWTVRERNYLLWMSELLNNVFTSQQWHRQRKLAEQEQRRLSKQRQHQYSALPVLHLQRTMSSSKLQMQRTMSSRSRQNSYIPPPNLPSTPSAVAVAACSAASPTSPTSPTSIPEEGIYPDPSSPLSPISPFSTGFPRGTLSKPPTSISQQQQPLDPEDLDTLPNLDIRIHTHVTGILSKSRSIATHIYAWLLETHRTAEHPASPLTGLLNPTQFGRPDFVTILDNHYQDMVRLRARDMRKRELERETKERERQRRVMEKERKVRERREREREERERKRRERELRDRAAVQYRISRLSFGSFRSGMGAFGATFPSRGGNGNGNRLSHHLRNATWSGAGNSWGGGGASVRRNSVLSGGITKSGAGGGRDSTIGFAAAAGGGGGHRLSHARRRRSIFSLFGADGKNLSSYNINNPSDSDMTLCSTGHVDSWYVYSSATQANTANAATSTATTGQGPSPGESATTIVANNNNNTNDDDDNLSNSNNNHQSMTFPPRPDSVLIETAIAHAVHLEEAIPEEVYIGSSCFSTSQSSKASHHKGQAQPLSDLVPNPTGTGRQAIRDRPTLPTLTTSTNPNPNPRAATGGIPTNLTSSRTLSVVGGLGGINIGIGLGNTTTSRDPPEILRIGVFYCGTPAVGSILADRCRALTARGHAEGTGIEYHFLTEVFG